MMDKIIFVLISVALALCFDVGRANGHPDSTLPQNKSVSHGPTKRQTTGGCNYNFAFSKAGEEASLNSPNYPGDYSPNLDCRYTISSPPGTVMKMNCKQFNIEPSTNCQYDVFFLSLTGDTTFSDQEYYCGTGNLVKTTRQNKLAIGFHSDASNPLSSSKYLFSCLVSVVAVTPPTTPAPTCSCGIRNEGPTGKIVGGTEASVGEFPWRCALYTTKNRIFCGCTIISANWVLTAAHCTNNVQPGDQIYVDVGDHDVTSTTDAANQIVPVDYVISNSLYNDSTQDFDSSLLRLSSPLKFSRNISPACLPWTTTNVDLNGQSVVASGWGLTFFGGSQSPVLRKVDLNVIGTAQCAQYYNQFNQQAGQGNAITVTPNMICAYAAGKDTCQGDSGGSIDWRNPSNGRYYSVGIVSQGVSCGSDLPGVYTKVSNLLRWIDANTGGENFCRV